MVQDGDCRRLLQRIWMYQTRVAVWIGPGHVQEFYNGIPNCMVIDSEDESGQEAAFGGFFQ